MNRPSRALLLELGVNLLGPWLVYRLCLPRFGEFGALVASGIPPASWALGGLARTRRLDALSLLVLLGIALSAWTLWYRARLKARAAATGTGKSG